MTVPAAERKAGPFNGNGSTTEFPFEFKVFTTADIEVVFADVDGIESVLELDSDYSVELNVDQDATPGGTVTYPIAGAALATGEKLSIAGALAYDQETDIPTGGNFNPTVLENALDKLSMQTQQLAEGLSRSVKVGLTSDTVPDELLAGLASDVAAAASSAASASASALAADASADAAAASAAAIDAGLYLAKADNLASLASKATARTNLGVAIGADVQAYNANNAVTNVAQSFTAAQRGAVSALTDGATITPDFAVANNFSVTLGGNRTLANPTNLVAGQSGVIKITQDGTGSRTLAFGSYWDWAGGVAPSLTTTASAVDILAYYVDSTTNITARLIGDRK